MTTRTFVDDGFQLPEAKIRLAWENDDTLLVGTDFGPDSLTASGYPRMVKRWRRGQPLAEAATVFTGAPDDVVVSMSVSREPGYERTFIARHIDFYDKEITSFAATN